MSQRSRRGHSNDGIEPVKSSDFTAPDGASSQNPSQLHKKWIMPVICVFLAIIVWVVFGQTLHYEFVNYDDNVYVYENAAVTGGLTLQGIASSLSAASYDNWIPLTTISHMMDWQFCGRNAGGHHLTNVLLHAANVILLFLVLGSITGSVWRSAFVAAVFAVHPLHVESVAWVAERKDVLSGLFFMLTLWAYARYAQRRGCDKPNSKIWYWLALAFFAFGLMSKPMLVTLPFVLLLMDYWPLKRVESLGSVLTVRGLVLEKVPFLLLAAAVCAVTILVQRSGIVSVQHFGLIERAGNAMVAYADYIWQMIYPAGLAVLYPLQEHYLSILKVGYSAVVLAVITTWALVQRRKYPFLPSGWLWYLGMLVPVIGLVQVGNQSQADRYTYLPQIGLYILLTWGAAELCRSWRYHRAVLASAAVLILAGLSAGAYVQTGYWKNSISLWTHTLACTTKNSVAHYNFGYALADQGKWTEAIDQYRQALQIKPDYVEAEFHLGGVLAGQGKLDEAVEHYKRVLQINPDYSEGHNNLGLALAGQGKLDEAIGQYEQALKTKPDNAEAHNNLGLALDKQAKTAEAIEQYRQTIQIKPDFVEARVNWGLALAGQGRWDEAISQYERALEIKPNYAQAHFELGIVLARQGKWSEAIGHYEQALQIKPDYVEAHYGLGVALARQGKWSEAIGHYERALIINPGFIAARVDLGIALTQQGKLAEAIGHFEQVLQIKPDNVQARYDLGLALARQGKAPEAATEFRQALELAVAQNNAALANAIRSWLDTLSSVAPRTQTP